MTLFSSILRLPQALIDDQPMGWEGVLRGLVTHKARIAGFRPTGPPTITEAVDGFDMRDSDWYVENLRTFRVELPVEKAGL